MDELLALDKIWALQALSWADVALWTWLMVLFVPTLVRANGRSAIVKALLLTCLVLHVQAVFFLLVALSVDRVSSALVEAGPVYVTRGAGIVAALIMYRLWLTVGDHRHVHQDGEESVDVV